MVIHLCKYLFVPFEAAKENYKLSFIKSNLFIIKNLLNYF